MKQQTSEIYSFMEVLESRIAPAGVVNATFSLGKLLLVGDSADNSLTLVQVGGGDYTLLGNAGTTISLNGAAAAANVTLANGITGISANLGDGIDTFTIANSVISGKVSFKGGAGNDVLTISSVRVAGSVVFDGGDGDDALSLNVTHVGGGISAALGNGNNEFAASGLQGEKSCAITSGSGDDLFSVSLVSLAGGLAVNAGDGDNTFTAAFLKTGGPLTFLGGAGNDTASFGSELFVGGKFKANLGAGDNTVDISPTDAHLAGLSVNAAGGNDTVAVSCALFENRGAFKVSLGDGTNTTSISTTLALIGGNLSVTGGAQDDVFSFTGTGLLKGNVKVNLGSGTTSQAINIFGGSPGAILVNGDVTAKMSTPGGDSVVTTVSVNVQGDELVQISGANSTIAEFLGQTDGTLTLSAVGSAEGIVSLSDLSAGATTIITGSANDTVNADDIHVRGKFRVNTGDGNDVVSIETVGGTDLPSTFDAIAKIILGGGNDVLTIGDNTTTAKGIFNAKAVFNGGAGNDTANVSAAFFGNQYAAGPATPGVETVV